MDADTTNKLKIGAGWLAFISICTFVNVVLIATHQQTRLLLGVLAVDVAIEVVNRLMQASADAKFIAVLVIGIFGAGIFAGLCKPAMDGKKWAYIVGIILYLPDTLLQLLCTSWLGAAIHIWALCGLAAGLKACIGLKATPAPVAAEAPNEPQP